MSEFPPARNVELPPRPGPGGTPEPPITLAIHEAGSGPPVVLCHGFPELAYSWRHVLPRLAAAGYRAIAPDQRGFGGSSRPEAIEAYDLPHLTGDLVGLLDALGEERAVFVGHDWGGFVVWAMAVLHPERTAGVVGVNTPYLPRPPAPPMTILRERMGGNDEALYLLWFQHVGPADTFLRENARLVFEKLVRRGHPATPLPGTDGRGGDMNPFRRVREIDPPGEPLLTPEEMDHYARTFERTGFTGGIHWYRNMDRNWEIVPAVGTEKISVPALMITAEWDPALPPAMADAMPALVPDLERVDLRGCGHWTPQERPGELTDAIVDWMRRRIA